MTLTTIREIILILVVLSCTDSLYAQRQKTVVYEQSNPTSQSSSRYEVTLFINDSVSYCYTSVVNNRKVKPKLPLGKKLIGHDDYIDLRRNLWIHPFTLNTQKDTVYIFPWTITTEEKEILGYKCYKAIGRTFRNSEITVWFTKEIPLPHGPEVIVGLPGLALEVKYSFSSNSLTAIRIDNDAPQIFEPRIGAKTILLTTEWSDRKDIKDQ